MNVTFHVLGSFATAAVLGLKTSDTNYFAITNWPNWLRLVGGFVIGIVLHGVFDFLPHHYPLPSKIDVVLALILFCLFYFAGRNQNRLLILVCFIGAIFPDIVDLSPGIANKHLGIPLPQLPFKIFPWHWKEFSGSIYDGSRQIESNLYHLSVVFISIFLIYVYRGNLLKFGEK